MRRSKAFNSQTTALFRNATPGVPIDQLIQYYNNGINQTKRNLSIGTPKLVEPELYLYGDLKRADDLLKQFGYNIPFFGACVWNPSRHQWSMSFLTAVQGAMTLNTMGLPSSYNAFDVFYEDVANKVIGFKGMGRSAIYDAALRIGHTMKLEPDEFVYIHETLRKCAEKIIGQPIPKNTYKIPRIEFDKAYPGFKSMPSQEIEDFICIYKDVI